jgi:uncharacterized protein (TIGR02646 family)
MSSIKVFLATIYPQVRFKHLKEASFNQIRDFDRDARTNFPPSKSAWSNFYEKGTGKKIHKKLGEHLKDKQDGHCCYCKDKIFHGANANIEHVLPIRWYPMFAFTYHNLALACATCNALKTKDDWFELNVINLYYRKNVFTCYHPNIDNYDDHVEIFSIRTNKLHIRTFVGKTQKGKKVCKDLLSKVSAFSLKESGNPVVAKTLHSVNTYMEKNPGAVDGDLAAITKRLFLNI